MYYGRPFVVKFGNARKSAHPPLWRTCKVLHPWALFREITVYCSGLAGTKWSVIKRQNEVACISDLHISVALFDPMAVAVLDNAHSTLNIQHIFICAIVAKLALNLANLLHYTLLVWMARCLSLRKYKTTGYFLTSRISFVETPLTYALCKPHTSNQFICTLSNCTGFYCGCIYSDDL